MIIIRLLQICTDKLCRAGRGVFQGLKHFIKIFLPLLEWVIRLASNMSSVLQSKAEHKRNSSSLFLRRTMLTVRRHRHYQWYPSSLGISFDYENHGVYSLTKDLSVEAGEAFTRVSLIMVITLHKSIISQANHTFCCCFVSYPGNILWKSCARE